MAILTEVTQLIDGVDVVMAKDIMDTQETAINANNNASTALSNSNQAITTANTALDTANEALEQVQSTGSKVYVNNTFQSNVYFNSDPQTQINNLNNTKMNKLNKWNITESSDGSLTFTYGG